MLYVLPYVLLLRFFQFKQLIWSIPPLAALLLGVVITIGIVYWAVDQCIEAFSNSLRSCRPLFGRLSIEVEWMGIDPWIIAVRKGSNALVSDLVRGRAELTGADASQLKHSLARSDSIFQMFIAAQFSGSPQRRVRPIE
jgi:hypothetical protein